jgi:hypothetical protein
LQLSSIPVPVTYTPIRPVPPVGAVKGRDPTADDAEAGQKPRAAPSSGIGMIIDLLA